jgi:hypothetical protein
VVKRECDYAAAVTSGYDYGYERRNTARYTDFFYVHRFRRVGRVSRPRCAKNALSLFCIMAALVLTGIGKITVIVIK